jgi:signal recognition particle receptor subunit beta
LPAALLRVWLSGPKGNLILLVGPCDAGKTTLFHQLHEGSTHLGTVASMQANEAVGPLASETAAGVASARPVQLVDVPGHPRVRGQAERYAGRAAGVVFVVDSVDFMPRKTEAAE